jgi:hypothetical protein
MKTPFAALIVEKISLYLLLNQGLIMIALKTVKSGGEREAYSLREIGGRYYGLIGKSEIHLSMIDLCICGLQYCSRLH